MWRGRVTNLQGRFEESIALLKTALELSADSSDPLTLVYVKIHTWAFLANVYLRQGRLELAREAADMTCQLIVDSKAGAFQVNIAMANVVEVNLALYERDGTLSDRQRQQLLRSTGKLCKQLHQSGRASQARVWYRQGLYLWHRGKQQQALRVLARHVMTQLELRRHARELADAHKAREVTASELEKSRAEIARLEGELARFKQKGDHSGNGAKPAKRKTSPR